MRRCELWFHPILRSTPAWTKLFLANTQFRCWANRFPLLPQSEALSRHVSQRSEGSRGLKRGHESRFFQEDPHNKKRRRLFTNSNRGRTARHYHRGSLTHAAHQQHQRTSPSWLRARDNTPAAENEQNNVAAERVGHANLPQQGVAVDENGANDANRANGVILVSDDESASNGLQSGADENTNANHANNEGLREDNTNDANNGGCGEHASSDANLPRGGSSVHANRANLSGGDDGPNAAAHGAENGAASVAAAVAHRATSVHDSVIIDLTGDDVESPVRRETAIVIDLTNA
mmetsp:Transcript_15993/g.34594  ORF Transcript_15993/g.34594 Transcript_15993/m.34594 type:complete len:291 (-) Transcript_15993:776-1648(-)